MSKLPQIAFDEWWSKQHISGDWHRATAWNAWLAATNDALAVMNSLEADAQRYRWLCSDASDGSVAWFVIERSTKKEECDAAIDAALSVGQISNIDKRKLSMEEDTGVKD